MPHAPVTHAMIQPKLDNYYITITRIHCSRSLTLFVCVTHSAESQDPAAAVAYSLTAVGAPQIAAFTAIG